MTPLHISNLGLTATGQEKENDPRREYRFNEKGRYILGHFFEMNPKVFRELDDRTIWLMPASVEDLLIFHAFEIEKHRFVIITLDNNCRELFSEDDPGQAKLAIQKKHRVLPNPAAYAALSHLH